MGGPVAPQVKKKGNSFPWKNEGTAHFPWKGKVTSQRWIKTHMPILKDEILKSMIHSII